MLQRLPRASFSLILVSASLLCCAFAAAATLQFGTRSLNIPEPQGFTSLSAVSPRYMQIAQAYLPATNRLAEAYATAADAKALSEGRAAQLTRYLQLQVPRAAEGTPVSEQEFTEAGKEMEAEFEKTMRNAKDITDKVAEQGNAEIKRITSTDPKVALSGMEYLGVFRREPWGMFFTIKSGVSAGDGSKQVLVCAGALVMINYQLLFMYSYSQYHDTSDREWAEQATSAWADATRAANPNDPAVAAKVTHGFFGGGIFRTALIGAIIGGLIGLFSKIFRKS
jgi:hypothetical protein